jgi:hypothetical protein
MTCMWNNALATAWEYRWWGAPPYIWGSQAVVAYCDWWGGNRVYTTCS